MSIASRDDVYQNLAKGKGQHLLGLSVATGTTTTPAAASGFFGFSVASNALGSTWPGTIQDFLQQPSPPASLFNMLFASNAAVSGRFGWLARFYLLGTVDFTATGNKFTHDAATFPAKRTVYGAASTAIDLIPVVRITTALTGTAPQFILKNSGGSAGYTNQAGSGVVGTKTTTLPTSAAAGTCLLLRLEDGDSAVQDVTQIDVTVAGSTGAGSVYGMELIAPMVSLLNGFGSLYDGLMGGLGMNDVAPAVAASGSASSFLAIADMQTAGTTGYFYQASVLNA